MKITNHVLSLLLALAVAGCASYKPQDIRAGQSQAELQQLMGQPTGRYPGPNGQSRLEFATGPYGRTTWMVDLDTGGRVVAARQVLNEAHFAAFQAIAPGMTRDELLRTLGRPGERRHGGWQGGQVWSWRYPTNDCLWFEISLATDGRVTGAGYAVDPRCDAPPDGRD